MRLKQQLQKIGQLGSSNRESLAANENNRRCSKRHDESGDRGIASPRGSLTFAMKARKVPFVPSRQRPRRIGRAFEEFHKLLSSGKLEARGE